MPSASTMTLVLPFPNSSLRQCRTRGTLPPTDIIAAEVIYDRADTEKDFMGLITWRGAMQTKHEAEIAKNYLSEEEVDMLNRIVNLYLDFAELQAKNHVPIYMKDWIRNLNDFLKLSGKELLNHAGSVSAEVAKLKANEEYDKFRERTQI